MKVPESIRSIPRPDYTVVYVYGPNKDKYGVRCLDPSSADYKKVVGHIVNRQFIACNFSSKRDTKKRPVNYKNWGEYYLANALLTDVRFDLYDYFSDADANRIFLIALLRVCNPDLTDHQLKREYETSILSDWFPEVPLCKDSVGDFFFTLGSHKYNLLEYMQHRMENVSVSDRVIIDGTLKTNDSHVNSLSAFSRKGRIKNRNDISILYAYSFENGEPICSECFPGNMVDAVSGIRFIERNKVEKGLLVTDKGFPPGTLLNYLSDKPDLHYLIPLKRDAAVIDELDLLHFEGALKTFDGVSYKKTITVQYHEEGTVYLREELTPEGKVIQSQVLNKSLLARKYAEFKVLKSEKMTDLEFCDYVKSRKVYYYSYADPYITFREVHGFTMREARSDDVSTPEEYYEKYKNKRDEGGTIVFQSDIDVTPDEAYGVYESRWSIEVCMKYYKTLAELDDVREHSDFSVIGSEFVNFFASLLAIRIERYIQQCGIKGKSGKDILRILHRAKKLSDGENWYLADINDSEEKILMELGVLPKPEPKKRGRKPNPKPKEEESKPKGRRGRPKKEDAPEEEVKEKRKPGRPRKEESPEETAEPKRKRGRPRKQADPAAVNEPKRKPGRPRKVVSPEEEAKPKRKPGRPRKDDSLNKVQSV